MPHYKLYYFNARGRAEISRLLFAQADVAYDDARISQEDWLKLKPTLPFNQMPALEVDGKMISQSKAIARYLARQFGMVGKSELESAKCDELVDGIDDTTNHMFPWFLEKDPEKKKELWVAFRDAHLKPFLARYEKFLNVNGTGYFVGNQLSWADLAIFHLIQSFCSEMLDDHPTLKTFMAKISDLPNIKIWLAKRPSSDF